MSFRLKKHFSMLVMLKCEKNDFRLIPKDDEINKLKADYVRMIEADMFLSEPDAFEVVIEELGRLQGLLNQN